MQKITLGNIFVAISIVFFILAILAEITLFNTLKIPKAEIDASAVLWNRIEFAYWLGAFSEGWLFSTFIISLFPTIKIGKISRVILIFLFFATLVMTISIRNVLWTL